MSSSSVPSSISKCHSDTRESKNVCAVRSCRLFQTTNRLCSKPSNGMRVIFLPLLHPGGYLFLLLCPGWYFSLFCLPALEICSLGTFLAQDYICIFVLKIFLVTSLIALSNLLWCFLYPQQPEGISPPAALYITWKSTSLFHSLFHCIRFLSLSFPSQRDCVCFACPHRELFFIHCRLSPFVYVTHLSQDKDIRTRGRIQDVARSWVSPVTTYLAIHSLDGHIRDS